MADSPINDFPNHGAEGKGEFGAGRDDYELTTPNVRGRRFPSYDSTSFSNEYGDHPTGHVHPPTDVDSVGVGKHPFKMERYTKQVTEDADGNPLPPSDVGSRLTLRVYYGELWSTVSVIRIASGEQFGVESQDPIEGIIRTVPSDFEQEEPDTGSVHVLRYVEFSESEPGDGGAFGTLSLEWTCNADPGDSGDKAIGVTSCRLNLIPNTEEPSDDSQIGQLSRHEDVEDGQDVTKLMRIKGKTDEEIGVGETADEGSDDLGNYSVVIGESRDPQETGPPPEVAGRPLEGGGGPGGLGGKEILVNEGKPPIGQQVFDHVYWAPTIVIGASSPAPDDTPTTTPYDLSFIVTANKRVTTEEPFLDAGGIPLDKKIIINPNKNIIEGELDG